MQPALYLLCKLLCLDCCFECLPDGEVLRHLLLEEEDAVLYVEPDDLAHGELGDTLPSEHGEPLHTRVELVNSKKIYRHILFMDIYLSIFNINRYVF